MKNRKLFYIIFLFIFNVGYSQEVSYSKDSIKLRIVRFDSILIKIKAEYLRITGYYEKSGDYYFVIGKGSYLYFFQAHNDVLYYLLDKYKGVKFISQNFLMNKKAIRLLNLKNNVTTKEKYLIYLHKENDTNIPLPPLLIDTLIIKFKIENGKIKMFKLIYDID